MLWEGGDLDSRIPDAHRSVLSVSLTNAASLFRLSGEPAARRIAAALLFVMCKNSDTTRTLYVKLREANAVVRRSSRRNSRINLHDGKDVIIIC